MTTDDLRDARHALGLTQRTVAELLGMTTVHYQRIEAGAKTLPAHHAAAVRAMLDDPERPALAVALYRLRASLDDAQEKAHDATRAAQALPTDHRAVTAVTAAWEHVRWALDRLATLEDQAP